MFNNYMPAVNADFGRIMIFTDVEKITKENVGGVISHTMLEHNMNARRESYLMNYEKGLHPILDRDKDIRPEINNRIVENSASKIVEVHTGYCFSNPVTFVRKTDVDGDGKEKNGKSAENVSKTSSNEKTEEKGIITPKEEEKSLKSDSESKIFSKNDEKLSVSDKPQKNSDETPKGDKKTKKDKEKDVDVKFAKLNRMFQSQYKAKKDTEMAHHLFTCGVGYQMALQSRRNDSFAPFELMTLNPLTTYVVYSNDAYREPKLGVTFFAHEDGTYDFTAYTEDQVFQFKNSTLDLMSLYKSFKNPLGIIPIVEFSLTDRMGVFEKAMPIIDALDVLNSDRVNDVAQHVQSILWMNNCEIDEKQQKALRDNGMIMTKSQSGKDPKIQYLSQALNQSEVQTLANYYQDQLMQMTFTPSWNETAGGSTTGAVLLSNGWQYLELYAKTVEMLFDEPEHRLLEIVTTIINKAGNKYSDLKDIKASDIEVKFNRNKTFDLTTKTNALVSMINSGVDGLTAFKTVSLFTDPQAAWGASKKIIESIQKKLSGDSENKNSANNKTPDQNAPHDSLGLIRAPGEQSDNVILDANAAKDAEGKGGSNNAKKDPTEKSKNPSKVPGVTE